MATIDESWYECPPGIRVRDGAGGVVVRVESGHPLVALVRADGLSDYLLPKGGVEAGESDDEAARREIEEEAGLTDLQLLLDLGVCERLNFAKTRWQKTHYFLFTTHQSEGAPTDRLHQYEIDWLPLDELPEMLWPEQRRLIDSNRERIRKAVLAGDTE